MKWLKNTPLQALKASYTGFHGFAFHCSQKSDERSLEALAANLRNAGITKDWPLLASYFNNGFVFVYEEMDTPAFWRKADFFNEMQTAKVEPLLFFLNRIKEKEEAEDSEFKFDYAYHCESMS
jgi:hypothetical protein